MDLYAYGLNNPVMCVNPTGKFWNWAIGAVAGLVGQMISDVITSVANGEVTISNWQTYTGAIVGGVAGLFIGLGLEWLSNKIKGLIF